MPSQALAVYSLLNDRRCFRDFGARTLVFSEFCDFGALLDRVAQDGRAILAQIGKEKAATGGAGTNRGSIADPAKGPHNELIPWLNFVNQNLSKIYLSVRGCMKFQFSTRSLLLAAAMVAIICAGGTAWGRIVGSDSPLIYASFYFGIASPLWMPVAFFAFALGHRRLTPGVVLAFAVAEAASIGVCYWMAKVAIW